MAKPIKIAIVTLAISRYNSLYLIHMYSFFINCKGTIIISIINQKQLIIQNQPKTVVFSKSTKNG